MLPDLISSLGSTKMTRGKLQDAVARRGVDGVHHGDDGKATTASGAVEKMGRGQERVEWQGDVGGAGGVLIPSGEGL